MKLETFDQANILLQASNVDELCSAFTRIMCKYGFDQYALAFDDADVKSDSPIVLATYDRQWVEYYFNNEYEKIDPVMVKTKQKGSYPFLWSDVWSEFELNKKQKVLFNEAKEFGISTGLGIPIALHHRDNGMISLASSVCNSKELEMISREHLSDIALLSNYFQQIAEKLVRAKQSNASDLLTEKEVECLTWVARGKTDYETARILSLSEYTIKHHVLSATRKLPSVNRTQACVKAALMKLIQPF